MGSGLSLRAGYNRSAGTDTADVSFVMSF